MGILTKSDYEKILNYYNIPFSSSESSKQIKNKAEEILAEKLCKCIKKVKEGYKCMSMQNKNNIKWLLPM